MGERHDKVHHRVNRIGWLRAAIMGANDGIVSTASLLVGVAAADTDHGSVVLAGIAGLVAGAMSMAAGEYVSVSSQADTEKADIALETREHILDPYGEFEELAQIYEERGLSRDLARRVARQLMQKDGVAAHTRDELGISEAVVARPIQAAITSATTFAIGASLPLVAAILAPIGNMIWPISIAALVALGILGALGARAGGADIVRGTTRVVFWGALAMAATAFIGDFFGAVM